VARETVDRYLDSWLVASRDAPAAGGRFPLVLVAQGNRQSAAAQAVLSEYLASHGFIVATTASPTIATPMTSEDQVGAFAQRQAMELSRAAGAVTRNFPGADASRIGLVGHSFGARAALLLAMQDARVSALVSLDGGIGTATGMTSLRREPSFRPKRMRAPILHLYEELDSFMKPDFTLFGELPVRIRTERVGGLRHVHFSTMGFGAAAFKELAAASGAGAEVAAGVRLMGERTVEFLSSLLADSPNRR
jgi:dienelactone hydrolase